MLLYFIFPELGTVAFAANIYRAYCMENDMVGQEYVALHPPCGIYIPSVGTDMSRLFTYLQNAQRNLSA